MKQKLIMLTLAIFVLTSGYAQFFKKITDAVGSVVNTGIKVTTAPYQALANTGQVIIGNAKPADIYKPYQEVVTTAGSTLPGVVEVLNEPQKYLTQKAQEYATSIGGNTGAFIFDIGTFTNRYYSELANAGAQNINGILQGQNPFQLTAAPLAAAIRAAKERYSSSARPLPDDVKNALRNYFSQTTLDNARYAIGKVEITLPNFIGQGAKFMGNDGYAVTVDNIIVFNSDPGSYSSNANWWAHEITHVQQYEQLGIETFSFNYIRDFGRSLESEAVNNANRITNSSYSASSSFIKVGSFDMSGAQSTTNYQQNPEYYVAQCIFPQDRFGAMYLVTNYGRIIAVNPLNGFWQHIGYSTPPLMQQVAWSYDLPNANWRYAVGFDGKIYNPIGPIFNAFGQVVNYANWNPIGYVFRFQ
ncbi:MAG: hypothetical protein V4561_05350 [Bacteroidota bacterium]